MVFYMDSLPVFAPEDFYSLLPEERVSKAAGYRRRENACESVLVYLLLCYAWFCETGKHILPPMQYDANGKPSLAGSSMHCSLTHCAQGVAVALDTAPVGVDMQGYRMPSSAVQRRVLSSSEQVLVQASSNPDRLFAALWTMKESYGKLTGEGIGYTLSSTAFTVPGEGWQKHADALFHTEYLKNAALSAAASGALPFVLTDWEMLRKFLENRDKE